MANVLFKRGLSSDFINLPKDPDTLYFVQDTQELYLGSSVYSFRGIAVEGEGDFVSNITYSPQDKVITIQRSTVGSAESVLSAIQSALDSTVQSITTDRGSAIVVDDTDPQNIKLILNIAEGDDAGNVLIDQCSDGLRANVEFPPSPVDGIKADDKILSLEGSKLSSTLTISYERVDDVPSVVLRGVGGAEISRFNASEFITDGMLDDVSLGYTDEGHRALILVFNTESGKETIKVDLSDLIDIYTARPGGGLSVDNNQFYISNEIAPGSTDRSDAAPGFGDSIELKTISYDSHGLISDSGSFRITLPVVSEDTRSAISVDTSSSKNIKIGFNIDDSGNVNLVQTIAGLRGDVLFPIESVDINDHVLSVSDRKLRSTISLDYYKSNGKPYVVLKGIGGEEISKFDASDFLVDGMLDSARLGYTDTGHRALILTFNTDSGKSDVVIDISDLVDIYTAYPGGGLKVEDNQFSIDHNIEPGSTIREDARPGFGDTFRLYGISYDSHGLVESRDSFQVTLPQLSGTIGSDKTLITYAEINNQGQLSGDTIQIASVLESNENSIPTSKAVKDSLNLVIEDAAPVWETWTPS